MRREYQSPPRNTRAGASGGSAGVARRGLRVVVLVNQSAHHCHTFPCMSYSPQAFGFFSPTGCVIPPEFLLNHATSANPASSSPQYQRVVVPARQAYSHSASVGSR